MIVFFNLSSLMLGLCAWILPVVNIMRSGKNGHRDWVALCMISISACAISLCFQIFSLNQRVKVADWSALMDTMSGVACVSAVLLVVTIILNAITLNVYRDRTAQ